MNIGIYEATAEERDALPALLPGHELSFFDEKLSSDNLAGAKDFEAISIFINSAMPAAIIDALPNLKQIAIRATGFDHIDLAHAKDRGIIVSNVPSYGSRTVAEFAFGLILQLSRKIAIANHQLRDGACFDIAGLEGFDLYGKTIGIVGTGKIGKSAAEIAHGFGMNILGHDAFPDAAFAEKTGLKYVTLPELLAASDIVTIHAPYNKDTFHLINKDNIGQMKQGAYLINTARGELVETGALLDALTNKRLAGAALDVLESERVLKDEMELLRTHNECLNDFKTLYQNHVLMDMENVIVTPHIAFFTKEAKRSILDTTAKNILAFESGKPENVVS